MLNTFTVIKRDGRIETLDVSKIKKYTSSATENLEGVSSSELELDAKIHFKDKIPLSKLLWIKLMSMRQIGLLSQQDFSSMTSIIKLVASQAISIYAITLKIQNLKAKSCVD